MAELSNKKAESVVKKMKGMFARFGIPTKVRSDNGSCFVVEAFKLFVGEGMIKHFTSSPNHPKGNELTESGIDRQKIVDEGKRQKPGFVNL